MKTENQIAQKIINEIASWLMIRKKLRDKKEFELADKIRKLVEKIYHLKVIDTQGSFTWTWKD